MTPGQKVDCIFCLAPSALELRITRKGGPMLMCGCCGSRTFIHGHGLNGILRIYGKITLALQAGDTEAAKELLKREVANAERDHTPS